MKHFVIFFAFFLLIESKKLIYHHYTLISTPFKEQTIEVDKNNDVKINYVKGQNVLIIFEAHKNVYLFGDNIHIYHSNGRDKKQFNYFIQRDGINCALFIYNIGTNLSSSSFYFKNIEKNFEYKFIIQQKTPSVISKEMTDIVMLGGTSIKYFGERHYFEVICYSNKPLKNKDSLSIETFGNSKAPKSIDVHNRNMDGHGKNYFDIRIDSHKMINKYSTVSYICKNNDNYVKETIITTYDFRTKNEMGTKKSRFFKDNLFLIVGCSTLLLILICIKFILPMYKIIKEKTKKREQDICMNATNFFLNYDLTENLSTTFDSYTKAERKEFDKQCIFTESDVRITYVLIKFPEQTSSIYLINNLTLDASVSFWKFAYSKNIELVVTLAPCFNYTNAKNNNDHFYEYAPGYFPEFIFDMIVSMKEKQKTDFTGIYLRDFEINKLDIGKDGGNNTITTSILQLYVANWSLNNNFPSLFYISHILSIIESLECENLLIHGTHLGRRADILVAIILLNKEIIKKIEEGIELNDKMIEEAILLFESITKSKKFNKFEFTLIVMSLIAHLIKKGYIQNKTFEKNLREIFIKTINDNKLSNI